MEGIGLFTVVIFGSFSCIWQRNKQKGIENDVKNGYRETPGKQNGVKMHFSLQAHYQKNEKWSFSGSIFATARLGFHFFFQFSFILSFNFEKNGNKMNEKWMKNGPKMPTVNDPNMHEIIISEAHSVLAHLRANKINYEITYGRKISWWFQMSSCIVELV